MEGLGEVREFSNKGRGGTQSVINVVQGGDTGGNPFWFGDLGDFGGNGEDGVGNTHRVSEADHREAGA